MHRFRRNFSNIQFASVVAAALLLVIQGGRNLSRADDDDDKPAPKTAVQKDRAADEEMFDELDDNEDGWLSGSEMKGFKSYDLDNNNRVTKVEFLAGQAKARLAKTRIPATPAEDPVTPPPGADSSPPAPPRTDFPKPAVVSAGRNNPMTPLVSKLAWSQAQLMTRYLSLLTTACEKGQLTPKETEQRVLDVGDVMPGLVEQLDAAKTAASAADRNSILAVLEHYQLLRDQARMLVEYARGKDEKILATLREAEAKAEAGLQKLANAKPAKAPEGPPPLSEAEQAVGAAAGEGDKLSMQVGKKFNTIFADENLNGLPGTRPLILKSAQEVAEILKGASARYLEAAALCEKAGRKATTAEEAKYWSLRGRSLRRMAEAKDGFRSITLLIEDEAIKDRATFEARAKPLVEEALELNNESQKLNKQAADLRAKLQGGK